MLRTVISQLMSAEFQQYNFGQCCDFLFAAVLLKVAVCIRGAQLSCSLHPRCLFFEPDVFLVGLSEFRQTFSYLCLFAVSA